jgi:PhnB protein
VKSAVEGERIFNALADGGQVTMPFAKTFWSPGFGIFTDRFGTPWMINCEAEPDA